MFRIFFGLMVFLAIIAIFGCGQTPNPVMVEIEVPPEIIEKETVTEKYVYRDREVEVPVEKIVEVIVEKPVEKIVEVIVEKPVDRIVEVPVEMPITTCIKDGILNIFQRDLPLTVQIEFGKKMGRGIFVPDGGTIDLKTELFPVESAGLIADGRTQLVGNFFLNYSDRQKESHWFYNSEAFFAVRVRR